MCYKLALIGFIIPATTLWQDLLVPSETKADCIYTLLYIILHYHHNIKFSCVNFLNLSRCDKDLNKNLWITGALMLTSIAKSEFLILWYIILLFEPFNHSIYLIRATTYFLERGRYISHLCKNWLEHLQNSETTPR